MLKWIASGCLVIVVIVAILAYVGYRKMSTIADAGPSITVSMKGTPERVFASMSHSDSLPTWFAQGMTLRSTRPGQIAAGDSIFVLMRGDSVARTVWVIDSVVPNSLVVMRWIALQGAMVVQRRRDSISVAGDSTRVISTVLSTMTDSLRARGQTGAVGGGFLDMASTLGNASARMQVEMELKRLKARIEGAPVVRP
jgi:uncharacterized protein YndB with AHSA1/START domain